MKFLVSTMHGSLAIIAFLSSFSDPSAGFFWQQVAPMSATSIVSPSTNQASIGPGLAATPGPVELVAAKPNPCANPTTPESVLSCLPRPTGAPRQLSGLFAANAYEQTSLNFQVKAMPQPIVDFYRKALTDKGYTERTDNTMIGDWGFNLVFNSPSGAGFTAKDPGKSVVLVIQGAMVAKDTLNLNLRFEELVAWVEHYPVSGQSNP